MVSKFDDFKLYAIVAYAGQDRVIGNKGQLPWPHIAKDMKRFRKLTMGCPCIMGMNTKKSLPGPLEGRKELIAALSDETYAELKKIRHDERRLNARNNALSKIVSMQIRFLYQKGIRKAFLIGGQDVFNACLNMCSGLYVTSIQQEFEGDKFFPKLDHLQWPVKYSEKVTDKKTGLELCFMQIENKLPPIHIVRLGDKRKTQ